MAKKYLDILRQEARQCYAWLARAQHRERMRQLRAELGKAFTKHPQDTGETYLEHLWFTAQMSARFLYTTIVLTIHGIFPFLLTRAASDQIEIVYRIIKGRIPQSRRDAMDADYHV